MIADRKFCRLALGGLGTLVVLSFAAQSHLLWRNAASDLGVLYFVGHAVAAGAILFAVCWWFMSRLAHCQISAILKKSASSQPLLSASRATGNKESGLADLAEAMAQMAVELDTTKKALQRTEAQATQQTMEKSVEATRITEQLRSEVAQCQNDQRGL